ncbi:chondroitinase-AC [Flavobacterium sp. FlaQc-57]|uniref:chondroitinase-AC n=1 Tax=Flavobacterium sp. FlaQc-57 TaxID=3374186 RepID=UPI003756F70B
MKKNILSLFFGCSSAVMLASSLSFMPCSTSKVWTDSTFVNKNPNMKQVYKTITDRLVEDLTLGYSSNKVTIKNISNIESDGSWPEIDYASKAITVWPPTEHLEKLETLVKAYITKESGFYGDDKVFEQINNAFQYWCKLDPKSDNWWFNEIGTPQTLGELLIMMSHGNKKLDKDLQLQLIERMKRGVVEKQAGANKTDIALHYFYRALLTEDDGLLALSVKEIFSPVRLVYNEEGLQYDNSYMQHGPHLYIGGYGDVFINGVFKMASYLRETPYALAPEKLMLLSNYYENSYLKTIRGKYSDFNVYGRGISRPNKLNAQGVTKQLLIAKMIDPEKSADWDNAIARIDSTVTPSYNIAPTHTQYFKADYTLHIRPNYSFNVRMVSKRTKRCEAGNNENVLGRYLSDGATNIQVNGPEYYNIMPIWEWDKIPGTTSRDYVTDKPMTVFWGEQGTNDFAGGVSDGVYGASAYALDYDNLQAKKAWFFFDDEIVCLGTDIKSDTPENITTTINQSWFRGNVMNSLEKNAIVNDVTITGKRKFNTWFLHDNVGYYFPQGGDITLSTSQQKGNWYHINDSYSKDEITGNVFKLWLNHGAKPINANYAYIVLPDAKSAADMKKVKAKKIQIAANNSNVQAVYHKPLEIIQAVFYQPGSLKISSLEIKVDKACIVMIKNFKGEPIVSVADPLYKEKNATLTITKTSSSKVKTFNIDFPQNEYAGSTVEVKESK